MGANSTTRKKEVISLCFVETVRPMKGLNNNPIQGPSKRNYTNQHHKATKTNIHFQLKFEKFSMLHLKLSAGMWMFYLNQGPQFESQEYNCVKYQLEEFCHPSGPNQLEFKLVGVQYSLQISDDLIHKKKIPMLKLDVLSLCIQPMFTPTILQNRSLITSPVKEKVVSYIYIYIDKI